MRRYILGIRLGQAQLHVLLELLEIAEPFSSPFDPGFAYLTGGTASLCPIDDGVIVLIIRLNLGRRCMHSYRCLKRAEIPFRM